MQEPPEINSLIKNYGKNDVEKKKYQKEQTTQRCN